MRPPHPWLPLTVGAATALLVVLRVATRPELFDRVWAEDGAVFLHDAQQAGAVSIGMEYAGYGHLVPRLLALGASALPMATVPVYVVVAVALTLGLLAWFAAAAAGSLTGSRLAMVVAGTSFALAPALHDEVIGNLANLQWFLLAAASWALSTSASRLRWGAALVAGLAAATTPLVALLLPAALLLHGQRLLRLPAAWGAAVGLAWQLAVMTLGSSSRREPPARLGEIRSPWSSLLDHVDGSPGDSLLAVTLLTSLLITVGVALVRHRDSRRLQLSLLLSVAVLGVFMTVYSGRLHGRYVAALLLLALVAVSCALPRLSRPLTALLSIPLLCAVVLAFPPSDYRAEGPSWRLELESVAVSCRAGDPPPPIQLSPAGWGSMPARCEP
ncbi:hypothetical protein [Auraticoccus monumenti]|uniref:hypothetical protein n=1 Tax=Auraticoccus monumenti TaxID=675864 RepID=UPI0012FBB81A|nr:hypothetical protein [Auraticoccus monumenti]